MCGREIQKSISSHVVRMGLSREGQGMNVLGSKELEAEDYPRE